MKKKRTPLTPVGNTTAVKGSCNVATLAGPGWYYQPVLKEGF